MLASVCDYLVPIAASADYEMIKVETKDYEILKACNWLSINVLGASILSLVQANNN